MFSILIPSYNNLEYLKFCIKSILKNSKYAHQIIVHVNVGDDGTLEYLDKNKIEYSYTNYNAGICEGINKAAKLAKFEYYLYAHDDFYFCPEWDEILNREIKLVGHNNFYLSGTMMNEGQINFNCGNNIENFDENNFIKNHKKFNYFDFQGTTWAPALVHKDTWLSVDGFSEEYFPGSGSDPDFNMKLWNSGVRYFKGINDFKVYHFGSKVLRSANVKKKHTKYGSTGAKIFLAKWGITIKFFKKFYLKTNTKFDGELKLPRKNLFFLFNLFICKLNFLYLKIFNKKIFKKLSL